MQNVNVFQHPDTWIEPDKLGNAYPPFQPTYEFENEFINSQHEYYQTCPSSDGITIDMGIKGWLRKDDALKLYELAWFSEGAILELGSYNGLSTSIISQAVHDSKKRKRVTTVDLMLSHILKTWYNLWKRGLSKHVSLQRGDAASVCNALIRKGKEFSFVFIDHSHTYEHCIGVCQALDKLVTEGGFCLFHDFNDPRECDPNSSHGVSRAVFEGLNKKVFEFYGIYGCTALYRKKPGT